MYSDRDCQAEGYILRKKWIAPIPDEQDYFPIPIAGEDAQQVISIRDSAFLSAAT